MKRIIFTNPTAQKIYDDYFNRVNRCVSILSANDQLEMMMELNSHIYEATNAASPANEVEVLVDTLEKLGAPEDVLQPVIAHKKVREATRSFNPKHIVQALYLNISNGAGYFVFAVVYLLIIAFGILIVLKLVSPTHTGLFIKDDHFVAFGFKTDLPSGVTELLGNWFIATVIVLMGAFYFLNTLLFRLLKGK
jgi:hypothetical protein